MTTNETSNIFRLVAVASVGFLMTQLSEPVLAEGEDKNVGALIQDCTDCPELIVIPSGTFTMGREDGEPGRYQGPMHQVEIDYTFAAGKFEVTNAQFQAFIEATGHAAATNCNRWDGINFGPVEGADWRNPNYGRPPLPQEPVVCVSWTDAKAYVAWLSDRTGEAYRLLSEAEWEYAARAGGAKTQFIWGDDPTAACRYANVYDVTGAEARKLPFEPADCEDGVPGVSVVGQFEANPFGLHDMTGNVWEWVEDCYVMTYLPEPTDGSAQTTYGCDRRSVRGGSWLSSIARQHPEFRGRDPEGLVTWIFGFRVARDL